MKVTVNTQTRKICNPDAPEREILNSSLPHIKYGDYGVLELDLINADDSVFPVLETDTLELIADKDYVHSTATGALNAALTGTITAVAVKTISIAPPLTGYIVLEKVSDGTRERFKYTARTLNSGIYTFTVSHTLTDSFSENDIVYIEDPLMLYSGSEQFNISGDRADLSLANGRLSVRYDAGNPGFEQKCLVENTAMKIELIRYRVGETRGETLLKDYLLSDPSLATMEGQPGTNDPAFYNAAQTLALLKSAPVREYSINGTTLWHSTQATADRFYREIRLNGEPTDAFPLPLSAYQEWLALGNTGTPTQFINSLKTINYLGAWVAGDYVLNDGVTHEGSLYVAQGSVSTEPPTGWTLFVSKGDAGTSAYQLWLDLGHTGTEEEFIASLAGAPGADATDGTDGASLNPCGDFVSETTYSKLDLVSHEGSSYISKVNNNTGHTPASVSDYWQICSARGANFLFDAKDVLSARSTYDEELAGFSFLAIDTKNAYFKNSATSGDWSDPLPFTGPKGDPGESVNPSGAYNILTTYSINALVTFTDGNSYVSRTNGNVGNNPSTDTTNWQLSATAGATGQTPKFITGTFVAADLVDGVLTITHDQGLITGLPCCISREISAGNYKTITPDDDFITWYEDGATIDLSIYNITGATVWKYAFGGCTIPAVVSHYNADAFPQSWKDALWPNITGRPALDYDQLNLPVARVDYNTAEGLGIILTEPLQPATTDLDFVITAQPHTPGATGTDMAWKADVCRYRAGVAETAIETITLGAMAFAAAGVTQTAFRKSLSDMLAAAVLAGDQLAMIIYPDTAAANRKQTDWMVLSVTIKAV